MTDRPRIHTLRLAWPIRALGSVLALATAIALGALVATAPPARAAALEQVPSFGPNPGALTMYSYRPDGLPSGAPLVVELHGCTQDAPTYFASSGWRTFADRYGFALVLAEQSQANNSNKCFNWFQLGDITRGQGEAASIAAMVDHAVASYGSDPSRVYVTGLSAGAAMTAVMLATYPDKFAGGSINAGLPYKCATSMVDAFTCMNPGVDKTPKQWGDLVRGAYSAYTGPRPRVSIWQGQSDTTVAPRNGEELRDQFTDVLRVAPTPTTTGSIGPSVTWEDYGGRVRLHRVAGMGHGTPVDPGTAPEQCGATGAYFIDTVCGAYYDAAFFGLDSGGSSPTPTGTATATATSTATATATATTSEPTPTATTTTTTAPSCVTASNYAHVQAGRAYQSGGYAWAVGSNQQLGLYNTYFTSTLKESSPGYWERC